MSEDTDLVLIRELIRDEGLMLKPYRDTVGKLTIGVGRNLDDVGISKAEALIMLRNDLTDIRRDFDWNIAWWKNLSEPRRRALQNMAFMGWPRLSQFKNMLAALQAGDYETAAREALDSRWATQVGKRAERVAALLRAG